MRGAHMEWYGWRTLDIKPQFSLQYWLIICFYGFFFFTFIFKCRWWHSVIFKVQQKVTWSFKLSCHWLFCSATPLSCKVCRAGGIVNVHWNVLHTTMYFIEHLCDVSTLYACLGLSQCTLIPSGFSPCSCAWNVRSIV